MTKRVTLTDEAVKQIKKDKKLFSQLMYYYNYIDLRSLHIKLDSKSPRLTEYGALQIISNRLQKPIDEIVQAPQGCVLDER